MGDECGLSKYVADGELQSPESGSYLEINIISSRKACSKLINNTQRGETITMNLITPIYKIILKLTHTSYGSNLILIGPPVIFNKSGATLTLGNDVIIKSSFLSNLVGLYSRTIIVTRTPEAVIEIRQ